jgi:hypothetical protein
LIDLRNGQVLLDESGPRRGQETLIRGDPVRGEVTVQLPLLQGDYLVRFTDQPWPPADHDSSGGRAGGRLSRILDSAWQAVRRQFEGWEPLPDDGPPP